MNTSNQDENVNSYNLNSYFIQIFYLFTHSGFWGNKLCRETNKCTVNEGNNKMSHKKSKVAGL